MPWIGPLKVEGKYISIKMVATSFSSASKSQSAKATYNCNKNVYVRGVDTSMKEHGKGGPVCGTEQYWLWIDDSQMIGEEE